MSTENLKSEETRKVEAILQRLQEATGAPDEAGLAKFLGVSPKTVAGWRFRGAVPYEHCERVALEKGVSLDWLVTGRRLKDEEPSNVSKVEEASGRDLRAAESHADYPVTPQEDIFWVPRFAVNGSAGKGNMVFGEEIVEQIAISLAFARNILRVTPENLCFIGVDGCSMEPTLQHGEVILVDRGVERVRDSDVYVVKVDGDLRIKRIQRRVDGTVIIRSDNDAYEPETYSAEAAEHITIVGRVLPWKFGRFKL